MGEVYYYVLTAFDAGTPRNRGWILPPEENTFEFVLDGTGNVVSHSSNTAVAIPSYYEEGIYIPDAFLDQDNNTIGNIPVWSSIFNENVITEQKQYKIVFDVDTLEYLQD